MQKIIQEYAEKSGYAAVFLLKPNDVAYLAPSSNLTDLVRLYNEKHPSRLRQPQVTASARQGVAPVRRLTRKQIKQDELIGLVDQV